MYVRLFICLSICFHISETTRLNFTKFLCMLRVAMVPSSSDGDAIRYVLPVDDVIFSQNGLYGA